MTVEQILTRPFYLAIAFLVLVGTVRAEKPLVGANFTPDRKVIYKTVGRDQP